MSLPCDFDEVQETTSSGVPLNSLVGKWDMTVHINSITFVAAVNVPVYDAANVVEGTKEGREQFLKQMKVDNGGYLGMGYRSQTEKESKLPDPYYKFAPRFTNVGYSDQLKGALCQSAPHYSLHEHFRSRKCSAHSCSVQVHPLSPWRRRKSKLAEVNFLHHASFY